MKPPSGPRAKARQTVNALESKVVALRTGEEFDSEVRAEPGLMKALEMIAPGAALREGIDSILHARTGGLIVIGEPEDLSFLNSGGIKLEIDYSPALLYQVAKMDGAIILNANATKITMANVQLMPDPTILSHETGTRHRTAERVSKQTDALVIAISQRREVVAVYADGSKYILDDIPVVLAKANQALATLDKDRKLNTLDYPVSPRGYRVLGRIPRLPKLVVAQIVAEFGGLDELLAAGDSELEAIEGVGEIRAKDIREGLRRLQEINLVDRYLQT